VLDDSSKSGCTVAHLLSRQGDVQLEGEAASSPGAPNIIRCYKQWPGSIIRYYILVCVGSLLRGGLRKSGACRFVSLRHPFHNDILLTSIRVHDLLIIEETTVARKHQNRSAHVAVMTATTSRVADLG
jgi:hypothetical protein